MNATARSIAAVLAGISAVGLLTAAPPAHAGDGWVAVANSPSHEQVDFTWGIDLDQTTAEARVLQQCTRLERARDCALLASGPDCVAIAWDADQPINHAHGVSGGGPDVTIQAAVAAAGRYANNPEVRCTWFPHVSGPAQLASSRWPAS